MGASRQFLLESGKKMLAKIKNHLNVKNNDAMMVKKSWIDVEFLQNAHDEISFCRQILKYTYVYAYYLQGGAEQNWFEMNASHIINYTNITHRFVKQLLDGIAKD